MSKITDIKAREILDSRGNPTVEVKVLTEKEVLECFQYQVEVQLVKEKPWN